MFSPFIIPLGCFVLVILIVAIVHLVKVRDKEMEIHQKLSQEQMGHQRKMKELEVELARVRQGS